MESTSGLQSSKMGLQLALEVQVWTIIHSNMIRNKEIDTGHGTRKTWKPMIQREQDFYPITFFGATVRVSKQTNQPMNEDLISNKTMVTPEKLKEILKNCEAFNARMTTTLRRPPSLVPPPSGRLLPVNKEPLPCLLVSSSQSGLASPSTKGLGCQSLEGQSEVCPSALYLQELVGACQHKVSSPSAFTIPIEKNPRLH